MLILWKEILYYLLSAPNDLSSFLLEESQVGWKSATLKNLFETLLNLSVQMGINNTLPNRSSLHKNTVTSNAHVHAQSLQSCPTLCNPIDHNLPGSSVHGILQARALERVAMPFSTGSSQPRDRTWVSCTAGRFFTVWATREAPK